MGRIVQEQLRHRLIVETEERKHDFTVVASARALQTNKEPSQPSLESPLAPPI